VKRVHVRIRGRVQGVGFRYEARMRASSLGISGWIRNAPDGSVEAVLEGDDDRVDSMVGWLRRGPRGARVDDVAVENEEPAGETAFAVR
jgi:acylphosphatase